MKIQILIIVGMSGCGKSTAVDYLTKQGIPKVGPEDIAIDEIEHLIEAGQKRIVLDGVHDWEVYRAIKKEWPGQTTTVAIVAPKTQRIRRVAERPEHTFTTEELQRRDYDDIQELGLGGVIAVADHYIMNDGPMKNLCEKLDAIVSAL